MDKKLKNAVDSAFAECKDEVATVALLNDLLDHIHKEHSPYKEPVARVRFIPVEQMEANDYNPNSVAMNEMKLLYHSIMSDGFTQPVVCVYDPKKEKYVIIDGFHRFTTTRLNQDLRDRTHGTVPAVVLDKPITDRMASTVRHNRARGKHSMAGMGNMVFKMLDEGMTDVEICEELGMEPDELIRLKHVTGFSKLFGDVEYRKTWETKRQIRIRKDWEAREEAKSEAGKSES
jgi:hypothetical protein